MEFDSLYIYLKIPHNFGSRRKVQKGKVTKGRGVERKKKELQIV